jgi:hypothetical protein
MSVTERDESQRQENWAGNNRVAVARDMPLSALRHNTFPQTRRLELTQQ